jgi:hypothetical protein
MVDFGRSGQTGPGDYDLLLNFGRNVDAREEPTKQIEGT